MKTSSNLPAFSVTSAPSASPFVIRHSSFRAARGFTLIEIILAMAVTGLLLTGAVSWLFSLSQLWTQRNGTHDFDQHVEGVRYFLGRCVDQSRPLTATETNPVSWERLPGESEREDPYLTVRLKEPPALLISGDTPLSGLYLHFVFDPDEGLSVIWHSQMEKIEKPEDTRRTLISPFVVGMEYAYYDVTRKQWEILEEPKKEVQTLILPDFLRLHFESDAGAEPRTVNIYLPKRNQKVPLF